MFKRVFNQLILPLGLCLFIAVPAFAGRPQSEGQGQGQQRHKGEQLGQIIKQLKLSADQEIQIKPLLENFRKEAKSIREAMVDARKNAKESMIADPFSESRARSALYKAAELKADMIIARIKLMNQIKTFLTPEQREQMARLQKEKFEKNEE